MIPFVRLRCEPAMHPTVFSGEQQDWSGLINPFMRSVANLDEQYHMRFILAVHHYAKALKYIGIDSEIVFIRLVSAVEALSSKYAILGQTENDVLGMNLINLLPKETVSSAQNEIASIHRSEEG